MGLKVDPQFVTSHWLLLLSLILAASLLKMLSLYPVVRSTFGKARAGPVTVLMNTRLTSASVILTLVLGLGLLSPGWYSIFISVVVVLALVSSGSLRAFPAFRSVSAARELFGGSEVSDQPERKTLRMPLPGHLEL